MKEKGPKCGGVMIKECCIKYGYMTNGNVAEKSEMKLQKARVKKIAKENIIS